MTSYVVSQNGAGSAPGTRLSLTENKDGAYIGAGVVFGSEDSTVIQGLLSWHLVTVNGVIGGEQFGIELGNDATNDQHERVTIGSAGEVYGYQQWGISITAWGNTVSNAGYVYGDTGAVSMVGNSTSTPSSLTNSGTLEGRVYGVQHNGTETLVFNNSGTVIGESYAYFDNSSATGSSRITNTGQMVGAIHLGGGNDVYEGTSGRHTVGAITGDDGSDTIRAGTNNDTLRGGNGADFLGGGAGTDSLEGGAGSDTLEGGLGQDRLDGGTDADFFRFTATLNNIDTIVGFSHADDTVQLDDAVFKTLGTSITSGEFYAAAGANKAHDSDDRIIYDTTSHKLYFDDDGNAAGGHAAVQFAVFLNPVGTLSYNDFTIV